MRAHPYLLAAIVTLLAACSDTTGPDLSSTAKKGGSPPTPGGTVQTPAGHQAAAK